MAFEVGIITKPSDTPQTDWPCVEGHLSGRLIVYHVGTTWYSLLNKFTDFNGARNVQTNIIFKLLFWTFTFHKKIWKHFLPRTHHHPLLRWYFLNKEKLACGEARGRGEGLEGRTNHREQSLGGQGRMLCLDHVTRSCSMFELKTYTLANLG